MIARLIAERGDLDVALSYSGVVSSLMNSFLIERRLYRALKERTRMLFMRESALCHGCTGESWEVSSRWWPFYFSQF
jgi:hypothetical protein